MGSISRSLTLILVLIIVFSTVGLIESFPCGSAQTGTGVNGIIGSDTTWTQTNSPYNLTGPVAVNKGVTLTVEAGATVNLNGNYLQVNGTLIAVGSSNAQINFNGGSVDLTSLSESWNNQTGTGSIIEHSNIPQLNVMNSPKIYQNTITAINSFGGSPLILNNHIHDIYIKKGSPIISNNNILEILNGLGTNQNFGLGQIYEGGSPTISNNVIAGIVDYEGSARIENNIISSSVSFQDSNSPLIENNQIGEGIEFAGGTSPVIENNVINGSSNGGYGVAAVSISCTGSTIISNNTLNGIYFIIAAGKYQNISATVASTGLNISGENNAYISGNVITKGGLGIGFGNDQGTSTIVGNIVSGVHGNGLDVSSGASLTIQGNTVENNAGVGISSGGKGKLTIQNNVISNNTDYGILSQGTGTMLIQNNTISRNGGGINLNSYSAIKYNNIQNNTQNSVYLSTASNIDATYNWWGTTDVQAINQTIYDFKDDFTVGTVNFVPFLTLPNPESIPNLNTTPIASGSPTPAVPEYPTWIILPLFVIALLLSSLFIRKKNNQKIAHHAFWS